MANKKQDYVDMEKYKKALYRQRKRYYQKSAIYDPSDWTEEQDAMVLAHKISDFELSKKIKHSVNAIQKRRWRLKQKKEA